MVEKVLLVEDDLDTADMIRSALMVFGHSCLPVTSCKAALEMVEFDDTFTVLLSDLGLPQRGDKPQEINEFAGFELAENIWAIIPGVRVIFCTGKDIASAQAMLPAGLGSVSFLQKPFRLRALQRLISPQKKAAVVAIADPKKEAEAIKELEKKGYTVHVVYEDAADSLAAEILRRDLVPLFDEIVVRT